MATPTRFDWLIRPQPGDGNPPSSEIGGFDTREIARRLGTDPTVVDKLLLRARESVRDSSARGAR